MESKLKALKVADLKVILSTANVAIHAKAIKSDLIAKVIASPAALQVYHQKHGSSPAVPNPAAPPPIQQDVSQHDTSPQSTTSTATLQVTPPSTPPKLHPATAQQSTDTEQPNTAVVTDETSQDIELEKHKARAARFNIPLVEPSKPKAAPSPFAKASATNIDDTERLQVRAARFGTKPATNGASPTNGRNNKRAAPTEPVDAEELERRRKRAERFGSAAS